MQTNAGVQSVRVSAAELSYIVESEFQGNVTYEFWVKARNRKHESVSSKLYQLTFDGTSNIDSIVGLQLQNMDDQSMTLGWDKIKKADGYIVHLVLPHPYPKIEPIRTQNTSVTIRNLVNGAQYVARVSAYVKNYTGRAQSLILKRNGPPLPEIQGIETSREGDHIRISWRKPTVLGYDKFTYGIYYGINLEELFDLPKHKTDNTSFLLTQLFECQSYLIGVAIIGPVGPGPLGKNPRVIETHYSERKPPKNLQVSFDDTHRTMNIQWDHSCALSNNQYPSYVVSIRELVLNQTSFVKIESNTNGTMKHIFHGIPRGAKYEITVSTDTKDAIPVNITAAAMPLPAPRLQSIYPEKNGSYVVEWREIKDLHDEK